MSLYNFFAGFYPAIEKKLTVKRKVSVPVISVGNITVGGTGKTPLVMKLLNYYGKKSAVVMRGYGRRSRGVREVLSPDVVEYGDEAVLLKKNFPENIIIVSADRYKGARKAEELGANLIILDDGFQSYELERNLDILLIDVSVPFKKGVMLPFGSLREPLQNISRADLILLTNWKNISSEDLEKIKEEIIDYSGGKKIFKAERVFKGFVSIPDYAEISPETLKGREALAFCGIGNPASFRSLLINSPLSLKGFEKFRDHHRWKRSDIDKFFKLAEDKGYLLVTTEKDAVRLPLEAEEEVLALVMDFKIDKETEFFKYADKKIN